MRSSRPFPQPSRTRHTAGVPEALSHPSTLTRRQQEIAGLIARGCTNQQIAVELALTPGTVANHVRDILARLGMRSRAQVAAWALEHGLGGAEHRRFATLERLLQMEATDLRTALQEAAQLVAEVLAADKVDALLYDASIDSLVALGTSDTPVGRKEHALGLERLPIANGGRTVTVFQTGQPACISRLDRDPQEPTGFVQSLGIRSEIVVPLDIAGARRGVLLASSTEPEFFSERDLRFLEVVARWVGAVAHRAELVEQIAETAAAEGRRTAAEELVTVLAHDLRNLLAPLQGRLDLLRRRAQRAGRPDDARDVEGALESVVRLAQLITELLDVARLEQGLFTIEPRPVDLTALARETAERFQGDATPIEVRAPEEVVAIVDPGRVRQALENLIANALKHSPPDALVRIEVAAERRDGGEWVQVTVADEGPGVAPEVLPRLFERFAASAGSTGLGLGLHLAQQIVAAHGGALTLDPAPGHGARFVSAMPAVQAPVPTAPRRAGEQSAAHRGMRFLT